jgi:hypothetical protein
VAASGAHLSARDLTTNPAGRAVVGVGPEEHAVSLTLELLEPVLEPAALGASAARSVSFALAVVPGAMSARRDGQDLLIASAVPRTVAYFALVTESERLLGGRVTLAPGAADQSVARVRLPVLPSGPVYAVVSSERDLRSPAAVGWPLDVSAALEPSQTFDAVDALLLDGRPRAAEHEARRRARVRFVVGAFSGLALALELALLWSFTRKSDRALDAHLSGAGLDAETQGRLAPKRSPALVLAFCAIALGFVVIAVLGMLRLR